MSVMCGTSDRNVAACMGHAAPTVFMASLQLVHAGPHGGHQHDNLMPNHYACPAGNPFAPGSGNAVSAPPMPSWGTGQDAAAPPASASASGLDTSPSGGFVQPKPFASSAGSAPEASAVPGGALDTENESCVVCMSAPAQAGFVHGSRLASLHPGKVNAVVFAWVNVCWLGCADQCSLKAPDLLLSQHLQSNKATHVLCRSCFKHNNAIDEAPSV